MRSRAVPWVAAALALPGAAIATAAPARDRAPATCEHQSSAEFPDAFTSRRNLVAGPLVLVGARTYSSPEVVREFGGQKYPALVAAGHTVRLEISRRARRTTALTYADAVHGTRSVAGGVRVVSFRACSRDEAASRAGRRRVTFWSGFILTSRPRCLGVKIWIDGASRPRRARIPLGRRC